MVRIDFDGWFQCRLATDPDPYDHPRGRDGWTFALPGEPDLDRLIRFHAPAAPRSRGPAVGVAVRAVAVDGADRPGHALLGAPVDLLDGAVFEGRNGAVAASASEPVVPFRLRVAGAGVEVTGGDPIDLALPDEVARRQPLDFEPASAEVRAATGVAEPRAHRRRRRDLLQADLDAEADPTRAEGLRLRVRELGLGNIREASLGFKLTYRFDLRGPNAWSDPAATLGPPPAAAAPWAVAFWMGGWDADALCGFVRGTLSVG